MDFAFRYDLFSRILLTPLGLGAHFSGLRVSDDTVTVRMGWGFRSTFPRSAVTNVGRLGGPVISRGVHGWRGQWLVNGGGRPLSEITLEPTQRARVCGVPVKLRRLLLSMQDHDGLVEALGVQ